jgi:hypothetical protein
VGKRQEETRQIALFVEGDTERGDARQTTLPKFFHNWLDPQLPEFGRVGIKAVKFQGVSNYLDDLAMKLALHLDGGTAKFVFGLVDLYGLPPNRIDLTRCTTVAEKIDQARKQIRALVPRQFQSRFRQHFAVHEVEAWLLAYPQRWPSEIRTQITKRPPEEVNFTEPPAKFLKRILGGGYKKTVTAKNIFPFVDPGVAVGKCPHLARLANDLLQVSRRLQ